MSLPRSILLAEPVVPRREGLRTVRAYGDADDPLRIVVLLADHLASSLPGMRDEGAACTARDSTWDDRITALTRLLDRAAGLGSPYAALVDPDALLIASAPRREIARLRRVLLDAIDRGGWMVARPWPSEERLTNSLDEIALEMAPVTETHADGSMDRSLLPFAPDVRPMLRWLVESRRVPQERIDTILEETRQPDDHVLALAYDALPEGPREAVRRVAAMRAPAGLNGSYGPFAWAAQPARIDEVARTDVEALRRAGFIQADVAGEPSRLVMARRARRYVSTIARALDASAVTEVHGALASDPRFEQRPMETQIEVHHHAARAGDVTLARETALYFGVELRALATELSRTHGDYEAAAELFRELTQRFDETDAYAWEYLAYNLARTPDFDREEVRAAYRKAHELDPGNALYHGRWIGFRAELGEEIRPEVDRALERYASTRTGDSVSWFIEPVLDGLARAKRWPARDSILGDWQTLLHWGAASVVAKHRGRA